MAGPRERLSSSDYSNLAPRPWKPFPPHQPAPTALVVQKRRAPQPGQASQDQSKETEQGLGQSIDRQSLSKITNGHGKGEQQDIQGQSLNQDQNQRQILDQSRGPDGGQKKEEGQWLRKQQAPAPPVRTSSLAAVQQETDTVTATDWTDGEGEKQQAAVGEDSNAPTSKPEFMDAVFQMTAKETEGTGTIKLNDDKVLEKETERKPTSRSKGSNIEGHNENTNSPQINILGSVCEKSMNLATTEKDNENFKDKTSNVIKEAEKDDTNKEELLKNETDKDGALKEEEPIALRPKNDELSLNPSKLEQVQYSSSSRYLRYLISYGLQKRMNLLSFHSQCETFIIQKKHLLPNFNLLTLQRS